MICVIIFTLISHFTDLSSEASVVGIIPKGLPKLAAPTFKAFTAVLPSSLLVVFISFVVTLSIGKTFEFKVTVSSYIVPDES